MRTNKCEWCGTEYPDFDKTVRYYEILIFGKDHHVICNECIEHLELIEGESK